MDEIVVKALAKWPNVPDCRGWLGLDTRGHWYMRDQRTQAAGVFPGVLGSRIEHPALLGFIERNYAADVAGAWFFQNGPQRVYVELAAAPWIWRLQTQGGVHTHTGLVAMPVSTWLDEQGRLFAFSDLGLGLVHSQDMHLAADWIESGRWPQPQTMAGVDMPARFGFCPSPAALAR